MAEIIATINDAKTIGGGSSSLPGNKCIKKTEVSETGCSLRNQSSYSDNQLIKKVDLYKETPIEKHDTSYKLQIQFDNNDQNFMISNISIFGEQKVSINLNRNQNYYYHNRTIVGEMSDVNTDWIFTIHNVTEMLWVWGLGRLMIDGHECKIKDLNGDIGWRLIGDTQIQLEVRYLQDKPNGELSFSIDNQNGINIRVTVHYITAFQ